MAINHTMAWRARPSGNNVNGGGYDTGYSGSSVTPAATGTHGAIAGNTFTDATAAAFTSGMVGRPIFIGGIGQFTIATFNSSSSVTFAEPLTGIYAISTTMATLKWAVGPGTDYSQQNSAQVSGSAGTAAATTTFTDATATFTSAMVGNAILIASGSGFTVGVYIVTAFTSTHVVVLDRSPGTGSAAVWKLGGAWADHQNLQNGFNYVASGNYVYFLGAGMPAWPYSGGYDYTINNNYMQQSGDTTNGVIHISGDPNTPSAGYPLFSVVAGNVYKFSNYVNFDHLWFVGQYSNSNGIFEGSMANIGFDYVIYDQNGYDLPFLTAVQFVSGGPGCEMTSSVSARGTNSTIAVQPNLNQQSYFLGWNIHDTIGTGLLAGCSIFFEEGVISKCGADGVHLDAYNQDVGLFKNNTVDKNVGTGIKITSGSGPVMAVRVINNLITNHSGTALDASAAGTQAQTDQLKLQIDFNSFYNNGTNYSAISPGQNDRQLSSTPYTSESTNNWTPVSGIYSTGSPQVPLTQNITGWNG